MAGKKKRSREPLPSGKFAVSLRTAGNWYVRHVGKKGISYSACHARLIVNEIVLKAFDNQYSQQSITEWMEQDLVSGLEAELVQQRLEEIILVSILAHFPDIASHVPEAYFYTINFDLIINVPETPEEQRGIFF